MHPGTAAPALRRQFGESGHGLRANATAPTSPPRQLNYGSAGDCHAGPAGATMLASSASGHRPCYRACTYHTLCIRSLTPTFFRERADNSPHTGPFGAGKNVAQSADMPRPAAALSRCLLTRPSRSGGGQAPRQLAGIPPASRPLPPFIICGVERPGAPTHPECSPPPSPGGCAQNNRLP